MINFIIGEVIEIIHIFFIVFSVFSSVILSEKYLHYYLFGLLLIFLDWNDDDGNCTLTKYEHYFKYGYFNKDYEFFRPKINKLLDINLSKKDSNKLNTLLFIVSFMIGYIRLLLYYNIIKISNPFSKI
jgi:hypothetical protein